MKYPCKLCLVQACCNTNCNDYYKFINYWAGALPKVTADEIHGFRMDTPPKVKRVVESCLGNRKRYQVVHSKKFIGVKSEDRLWSYEERKKYGGRSE